MQTGTRRVSSRLCGTRDFRPPSFAKGFSNSLGEAGHQAGHAQDPGAHSPSSLEVSCLTTESGERVGGFPSGCRRLFLISIFILEKAEAAWRERRKHNKLDGHPPKREQDKRGRAPVRESLDSHSKLLSAFWLNHRSLPSQLLEQTKANTNSLKKLGKLQSFLQIGAASEHLQAANSISL